MTLGLAMIVKNGAKTMGKAIRAFEGQVAEISIVLGGKSNDDTPAFAEVYADKLSEYVGTPFDFGAARQQSFDQLDTDWIVVVDADDVWQGTHLAKELIEEAEEKDAVAIYCLYRLGGNEFYQPRLFKNGVGQWQGAVHELYKLPDGARVVKTSELVITQNKDDNREGRALQNIEIGESWIERRPTDMRAIAHLIKDHLGQRNIDRAKTLADRYMDLRGKQPEGHYDTEYLGVLQAQAEIHLLADDYEEAAFSALKMLQVRGSAAAWAVLAEATSKMAHGSQALLNLAVFASDQAIFSGKPRNGQLHRNELSGSIPCLIKAMALHELGQDREALHTVDLGRLIDPSNDQLVTIQKQLAERLNEAA